MNNNDEDNIRSPDHVKIEQLINNDFHNININPIWNNNKDYDINTALDISKKEFDSIQQQEENKTIELICKQNKEQKLHKFDNIKTQLNKIILFDRNDLQYYELVLSIIELFELGFINEYKITNKEQHTNIFRILKSIRLPPNEIDNLKKIIICE